MGEAGTTTDGGAPRAPGTPDPDALALFALRVWTIKQGEVLALMVHLGDRLGLYRAMAGAGPLDAAELARRAEVHERWALEWLRSQAAAGLVGSDDGAVFTLSPEAEAVLVDESGSLWFAAGAFQGSVAPPDVVDRLAEAFRTGIGLSYDEQGPSAAHVVERMLGPWSRLALVPVILSALEGVTDKLRAGARVMDVGCGAGVALLAMAEAFPRSSFEGFDPSVHAVDRARTKIAGSGLTNVRVHLAEAAELQAGTGYDLVLTLDCLHDMARPHQAVAAIRAAIADDGTWLVKDIRSSEHWQDNLRNPLLAMMYGTSVATCMSSGLSEPGGAGLGTLGLPPTLLEAMVRDAGFTRFTMHDFADPANLYYEIRP